MKRILLVLVMLFMCSGSVLAADQYVEWRQSVGAAGYNIQTSVDLGATWAEVPNLTYAMFILLNEDTQETRRMAGATITFADNILVLARISAYNLGGETWRLESGVWYNSAWMPLVAPTGLGAN